MFEYMYFMNNYRIFVKFIDYISKFLKDNSSITCIFCGKELPISQRVEIMSCLPKKKTITLLNVIYNLVSGRLSYEIRSPLDILIFESQSGLIKGRFIGENIRFIYDLMHYTEHKTKSMTVGPN